MRMQRILLYVLKPLNGDIVATVKTKNKQKMFSRQLSLQNWYLRRPPLRHGDLLLIERCRGEVLFWDTGVLDLKR